MTAFKMHMLMQLSCIQKFLMRKQKKSPPSNKNIPVRNLKDQIAKLSSNDCAGFRSEYEVRFSIMILFPFDDFYAMVNASYRLIYRALSCCKIYH